MHLLNIHFHFTKNMKEEGCYHSSCTENNNLKGTTLGLRHKQHNQTFESTSYNIKPYNQVIVRYAPSEAGALFENAIHVVQQDMTA